MAGANAESFNLDHSTLASMTNYSTYFAEGSEISFWIDWQGSTTMRYAQSLVVDMKIMVTIFL